MNPLFQSKPNNVFVLSCRYSKLFDLLWWFMSNYSFKVVSFQLVLWFESPLFLFILICYRFDLVTNKIRKSTIHPSLFHTHSGPVSGTGPHLIWSLYRDWSQQLKNDGLNHSCFKFVSFGKIKIFESKIIAPTFLSLGIKCKTLRG